MAEVRCGVVQVVVVAVVVDRYQNNIFTVG